MANGQAGAPFGNKNALKAKRWQQAIDRALAKRSGGDAIKALDELAEKYLESIAAGDKDFIPGFSSLGDRLDGRPAQQVIHSGDEENPVRLEKIERVVVDPKAST